MIGFLLVAALGCAGACLAAVWTATPLIPLSSSRGLTIVGVLVFSVATLAACVLRG